MAKLSFNPYTYARVSVMKAQLIKKDQWPRMLKMSFNELLRYLQDGKYREQIDSLGVNIRDIPSLEKALNTKMNNVFAKLKRISDENLQDVLKLYLLRYDVHNYKTIIRGKKNDISKKKILEIIVPSVNYPCSFYENLINSEALNLKCDVFNIEFDLTLELSEIENTLDREYYKRLIEFSSKYSREALAEFINTELLVHNAKIILRLTNILKPQEILKLLQYPKSQEIKLVNILDAHEQINFLQKLKLLENQSNMDLSDLQVVEIDLDKFLLRKELLLMHKYPLTANVILGFMFAQEIEIKNLKTLLKGKKLGFEDAKLAGLLAVA